MKRFTVTMVMAAALLVPGMRMVSALQVHAPETTTYVVKPGDNLWKIAATVAPEGDNRDTVAVLLQMNPKASATLIPGQPLTVPMR